MGIGTPSACVTQPGPVEDAVKMNNPAKFRRQTRMALLTIVIGVVLLIMMIVVEREPGALPLLLIVSGLGCYGITRVRMRSQPK